ncbi:MAG TPA: hypothetical protein VK203_13505 [Nostocaceae cyanobacterium]|nr:hypothetical protein [Nostocaceae cyanobacterium]
MTTINKLDLQVLEQLQQWEKSIVCSFMQVLYPDWSYLDPKNVLMEVKEDLASGDRLNKAKTDHNNNRTAPRLSRIITSHCLQ